MLRETKNMRKMNMETCDVCKCARYWLFPIKNHNRHSMIEIYVIFTSFLFYTFDYATRKKQRARFRKMFFLFISQQC